MNLSMAKTSIDTGTSLPSSSAGSKHGRNESEETKEPAGKKKRVANQSNQSQSCNRNIIDIRLIVDGGWLGAGSKIVPEVSKRASDENFHKPFAAAVKAHEQLREELAQNKTKYLAKCVELERAKGELTSQKEELEAEALAKKELEDLLKQSKKDNEKMQELMKELQEKLAERETKYRAKCDELEITKGKLLTGKMIIGQLKAAVNAECDQFLRGADVNELQHAQQQKGTMAPPPGFKLSDFPPTGTVSDLNATAREFIPKSAVVGLNRNVFLGGGTGTGGSI